MVSKSVTGNLYIDNDAAYQSVYFSSKLLGSPQVVSSSLTDANRISLAAPVIAGISGGTRLYHLIVPGSATIVGKSPGFDNIGGITAAGIKFTTTNLTGTKALNHSLFLSSTGMSNNIQVTDSNQTAAYAGIYISANITLTSGNLTLSNAGDISVGSTGQIAAGSISTRHHSRLLAR